jgi:hypothetical protein
MTTTWVRSMNKSSFFDQGWFLLAQIPSGSALRRVRFSWGFAGFTEVTTDLHAAADHVQLAGVVTVIGNGSEVPPLPNTTPSDVAPPTQRWLWWEAKQPVPTSIDAAGGTVGWRDSGSQEVPDIKVNVLATGIPGGDSLDVWFSYQCTDGAWDTSGSVVMWVFASVLYTTP